MGVYNFKEFYEKKPLIVCDLVTIHFEYGINGLGTVSSRFIPQIVYKKAIVKKI